MTDLTIEEHAAGPSGDTDQTNRRDGRHQSRGKLGGPENAERQNLQPVEEDRFVEERLAVVDRREPVTRAEHAPTDDGVHGFIRIPEAGKSQPPECDHVQNNSPSGPNSDTPGQVRLGDRTPAHV
jgi:hypothetical protein